MSRSSRDHERKLLHAMELGLRVVWNPADFEDLARHAEEAMALTRELTGNVVDLESVQQQIARTKAMHPGFVGRAESAGHPENDDLAPVVDLFTGRRLQ